MDTGGKRAYDAEGAAVSLPSRERRFMQQAATRDEKLDLAGMVADLNGLLRLKTTVIGMKMFARADEMLASGRLNPPDICLVYATPGQMIILINGLQWTGYKKFEWGVVGETACADSWGRALKTGEPSLSLPCYAERRYGGVPDEEMLMALSPKHLVKAITGMKALSKNGLRYPIAPYGIQSDVRAGMGVSYAKK